MLLLVDGDAGDVSDSPDGRDVEPVFRDEEKLRRRLTAGQQRLRADLARCFLMMCLVFCRSVNSRKMKKPCSALNTSGANLKREDHCVRR